MSCPDCFNNCDKEVADGCIEYTGDAIPLLGICTGDPLSKVEAAFITAILSALDGTGITVDSVTLANCSWLQGLFIGKDPTLGNLIQLLVDANCTLKQLIDNLSPSSYSFDTVCLTGLPTNPTSDDILQAVLIQLCSLSSTVSSFPTTYVKLSDLNNLIAQYIANNGGNGSSVATYSQRLIPNVAYAYFGSLSNFDPTGAGLAASGFDKIYICNGNGNGTPDLRGRAIVGAVRNVPGGTLDAAVDPANPINPNTNYAIGDKFGENYHINTIGEIPSHAHGVTDSGHTHTYSTTQPDGRGSDSAKSATATTKQTGLAFTGISIQATGGGLAHENRQPSVAGVWIMFIP